MSRNFKTNPRTVKESLLLILKAAHDKKLFPEHYSVGNDYKQTCAIGALFTEQQLDDVCYRELNDNDVCDLFTIIGKNNIMAMTGMILPQLRALQSEFDRTYTRDLGADNPMIRRITTALSKGTGHIQIGGVDPSTNVSVSQTMEWCESINQFIVNSN